jgi:hypothetical protein
MSLLVRERLAVRYVVDCNHNRIQYLSFEWFHTLAVLLCATGKWMRRLHQFAHAAEMLYEAVLRIIAVSNNVSATRPSGRAGSCSAFGVTAANALRKVSAANENCGNNGIV